MSKAVNGTVSEQVLDLPPSAKLVLRVLCDEHPMAQKELAAETALCDRTTRYAVRRLEEIGAIASQPSVEDARKTVYSAVVEYPRGIEQ